MKILFSLLIVSVLITSCVSKVWRPKLIGIIVDEQGKPIDSCIVGETYTDKNGKFELLEKTTKEFFSVFGEPPIFISEQIRKNGYEPKQLIARNRYGGVSKGTIWDMDTVRLRKKITDFSRIKLKDYWLVSMTKKLDTVFMTKKEQEYDEAKIDFISRNCHTYSAGYYYVGINNLPENVFERHIELDLTDTILKIQKVLIYGDSITSEKTKYDTIYTQGTWKQEYKTLYFKTDLPEINGTYKVFNFNHDSMELVKQ
ncbi:hypothetical protein [Aquimarina sp. I32.4]|uniref:hypothetical protein n=1 Tax=Aquimarina sp. I32.4 TaxID=2053903 RepID=UPI000CDE8BED|nr:hypothetical protein [Aquimarina sp. I32.4]